MPNPENFSSKHFKLEKIAPGVYAALHQAGGAAIGNAAIIDLGDSTLVLDTFISPAGAKDLRLAAQSLTGKPVSYVFNSHYHNDHIRGNQVFPEATIISTAKTLQLFETSVQEELAWDQEVAPKLYHKYREALNQTQDPAERANIRFLLDYYRVLAESLDGLKICKPQQSFENQLTLNGQTRSVELLCYGGGHTASDGFIYLPQEGVLFLSDLLFVGCHPFLADGHPENLIAILEKVSLLDAAILVPGHGPVGSKKDLDLMIEYVQWLAGASDLLEEIQTDDLPAPFNTWELEHFFRISLGFMSRWQAQNST